MQKTKYDGIYKQREGVLLNMDNEALKQYKLRKHKEQTVRNMEKDVSELKDQFQRIEDLLMKLVSDKETSKDS